jgi:hypothetical protein
MMADCWAVLGGDAVLDQLLQPGDDVGWRVGIRAGDIGKVLGEGGIAGIDVG